MPDDVYIVKATWDLGVPIIDYRITEDNMNDNQDNITAEAENPDMVNHPPHYTNGPNLGKLECLDITRWMPFTLGNAFKYVWRAGLKGNAKEDFEKAKFYLDDWKQCAFHDELYPKFVRRFLEDLMDRASAGIRAEIKSHAGMEEWSDAQWNKPDLSPAEKDLGRRVARWGICCAIVYGHAAEAIDLIEGVMDSEVFHA